MPNEVVTVSKKVTEKDIKALYNKGNNLHQIATEVYGFDGEEAVENIRRILGVA